MTDTDADPRDDQQDASPPVIDRQLPPAEPKTDGPLGSIRGADAAGLGLDAVTNPAPAAAAVDPGERLVPGADFGDHPPTADKPWETSLATISDDAEMGARPDPAGEE